MRIPFDKRSQRIVTVLVGAVVLTLTIVCLMHPSLNDILSQIRSIATASYIGYMGWCIGYEWGIEMQSKIKQSKVGR